MDVNKLVKKSSFRSITRAGLLFTVLLLAGWGLNRAGSAWSQDSIIELDIPDPDGNKAVIIIHREPQYPDPASLPPVDFNSLSKIKLDPNSKTPIVVGRIRPLPGETADPEQNLGPVNYNELSRLKIDPNNKDAIVVGRIRPLPEEGPAPGRNLGPVNFRELGQVKVDPITKEAVPVGRLRPVAPDRALDDDKAAIVVGKIGPGFQVADPEQQDEENPDGYQLSSGSQTVIVMDRTEPGLLSGYPVINPHDLEELKKLKLDPNSQAAIVVGRLRPAPASGEMASWGGLGRPDAAGQDKFYMFQGDDGVINLTDAPTDPRYRTFQVSIRFQVAQSGGGRNKLNLERVRPHIQMAAIQYNLDPALIAAVIKAESAFDAKAVSWAGAQGLMQLIPSTARLVGCLDPFNPQDNIMGGSRYLRMMLTRFNGDLVKAIAAYNCGPERVAKANGIPNIRETQNYVKIVLANYERYRLQSAFIQ